MPEGASLRFVVTAPLYGKAPVAVETTVVLVWYNSCSAPGLSGDVLVRTV